jgi:hypothetical protein
LPIFFFEVHYLPQRVIPAPTVLGFVEQIPAGRSAPDWSTDLVVEPLYYLAYFDYNSYEKWNFSKDESGV